MLNPQRDKEIIASALHEFAEGKHDLAWLRDIAWDIIERWTDAPDSKKPLWDDAEMPLWNAVWDISSSCEPGLLVGKEDRKPILVHLEYLPGQKPLPPGVRAQRP